jgi:hypothetical protein
MTALALTTHRPDDWITVAEAARRLNVSERHVRRLCESTWQRVGLARQDDGQWNVHIDADDRLKRQPPKNHLHLADEVLRGVPETARKQALERKQILDAWETATAAAAMNGGNRDDATKAFCVAHDVPRSTLYRWRKDFKACGFAGLIDQRKAPADSPGITADDTDAAAFAPFIDEVRRAWLRLGKPKASVCYEVARHAAMDHGWDIPSYRHVCRRLAMIDKATRVRKREGVKAFTDQCEPPIQRDYSALRANEMWVGDHHVFDVWVKVGEKLNRKTGEMEPVYRRPWLTAFMDMATRKLTAWTIRAADPDTEAILEALLNGFRSHGLPESSYCDNGKDFDAATLTGVTKAERRKTKKGKRRIEFDRQRIGGMYAALNIRHIRAIPYRPQSKPIERFFRTYEDRAGRLWPTYCGSNPQDRPEGLPKRMHKAPTLAEFIEHFRQWLEADYHDRVHTGDSMGCTPNQAWDERLTVRRDAPDELLELLTQKRVGPVAVTELGVRYQKLYYGQMTDEVCKLLGGQVYLRINPQRIGMVSVWDEQDRFICVAPANVKVPANASSQDLRVAIGDQRRQRKKMLEGARAQEQLKESLPARLVRAARARAESQAPTQTPPPGGGIPGPVIKPVFGPMLQEVAQYQREQTRVLRRAVGDGTVIGGDPGGEDPPARFSYKPRESADAAPARAVFSYVRRGEEAEA